jgi:hypothetical protein
MGLHLEDVVDVLKISQISVGWQTEIPTLSKNGYMNVTVPIL